MTTTAETNWRRRIAAVVREFRADLGENDVSFLRRVFAGGLAPYRDRLEAIGFAGQARVLDAGCGFGQWALALAERNAAVAAVDAAAVRIRILARLAQLEARTNLTTRTASTTRTRYPDAHFDAVFCYGVLFATPWRQTLAEFARVLRPGGRLYVTANGFGWTKHLWYERPNAAADYDPRWHAAMTLLNTWGYEQGRRPRPGVHLLIEPEALTEELRRLGFGGLRTAAEGHLRAPGYRGPAARPFFRGEYRGDPGIYEVLARKRR